MTNNKRTKCKQRRHTNNRKYRIPIICRKCEHKGHCSPADYHSGRARCIACGAHVDRTGKAEPGPIPHEHAMGRPSRQVMPFGKYQGHPLRLIPTEYLEWALANLTSITPELQQQIAMTLWHRSQQRRP